MQPVIVSDRDTGKRALRVMRWPGISTINAKAETLLERPLWKQPFLKCRCLVPASGYYEWQKAPSGEEVHSYAIITTEANELGAPVQDRMPVILHSADYDRWLSELSPEQPPVDLLRPMPADEMKAWPVSKDVGNVRNNDPSLCVPV